ncbi:MAG TPA: LCP family protein [Candidatus Limnocylindrales bacterium]|nr:LCP family protein [Candidatus Limnocylindrales bacterium]
MGLTETLDDSPALSPGDGANVAPPPKPSRGASPGLAAVLSLVFPGLGQLFAGAIRRGLLVAIPTVALIIVVGASLAGGYRELLAQLVEPPVLAGILILNVVYAIYHLFAIGDAFWTARRLRATSPGRRATAALVVALAAATGIHGLVGAVGLDAYQTVSTVIVGPSNGFVIPAPSFVATGPTPSPGGTQGPTATPGPAWAADGRLNLLLIGGDAGPGRYLLRTDTMILLSVDVATGQAALFGLPRNLINAPVAPEDAHLFPGGRFPGLLNAIWVYAYQRPGLFPDGNCVPADSDQCGVARGFRAIAGAIQQLTGVPLDGAVVVNLNGFVDLVNAVAPKGIWVDAERVYDTHYPMVNGTGDTTVSINPGCQRFNGTTLLEYARSRHQDSDYGRMARQQQVLIALLRQLDPLTILPQVPRLLDIAKSNLILAIPSADIGSLAALAARVDSATVQRIEFDPPTYPEYMTSKEISNIQKVVQNVFGPLTPVTSATPIDSPTTAPTATPAPTSSSKCGP